MEVKICKGCKRMFQHISGPELCPKCRQIEEERFQTVKDYLRENPGETLIVVSKETGVSVPLIEKFLRQGRLEVAPESPIRLTCERCGKKITTGKYCTSCMNELTNELHEVKKSLIKATENEDSRAKMRYLQHKDRH